MVAKRMTRGVEIVYARPTRSGTGRERAMLANLNRALGQGRMGPGDP